MFLVPGIDAGQIDMLPAKRRDVYQHVVGSIPAVLAEMSNSPAEINGDPVHHGADDEIEPRGTESLAIIRTVSDFAAVVEANGPFEFVGGDLRPNPLPAYRGFLRLIALSPKSGSPEVSGLFHGDGLGMPPGSCSAIGTLYPIALHEADAHCSVYANLPSFRERPQASGTNALWIA